MEVYVNAGVRELRTELCFLEVPAPQSAHVVDQLVDRPCFAMAAAVYSGVDVVAVVEGTEDEIEEAYRILAPEGAPNIESYERFPAEEVLAGASANSSEMNLSTACIAFVRCVIRVDEVTVPWAASVLKTLPGVRRLFLSADRGEVILEVLAPGKEVFDRLIMSSIQGEWSVVRSTRTFLLVNHMRWERAAPFEQAPIFISTAAADLHRALALGGRIHADTGIPCWTYSDIPIGTPSWTSVIDDVIAASPMKIFILSKAALASDECQREFGRVEASSDASRICCLVLPECAMGELPPRYQQRQCLSAEELLAYPLLLDWIRNCFTRGSGS